VRKGGMQRNWGSLLGITGFRSVLDAFQGNEQQRTFLFETSSWLRTS
jgi:hypothetical protein